METQQTPEQIAEQISEIFSDLSHSEAIIVAADLLRKWKAAKQARWLRGF